MNDWIFDLDGTLFDSSGRQHYLDQNPKDWDGFFAHMEDDPPYPHMFRIARALYNMGDRLIVCTGRPDNYHAVTIRQLIRHKFPPVSGFYMRGADDKRNDDILKMEMLAVMRADGFNPVGVFEDRNRVVAAYREAGIPCLQPVPGDF